MPVTMLSALLTLPALAPNLLQELGSLFDARRSVRAHPAALETWR
jgi:hypothetical protein